MQPLMCRPICAYTYFTFGMRLFNYPRMWTTTDKAFLYAPSIVSLLQRRNLTLCTLFTLLVLFSSSRAVSVCTSSNKSDLATEMVEIQAAFIVMRVNRMYLIAKPSQHSDVGHQRADRAQNGDLNVECKVYDEGASFKNLYDRAGTSQWNFLVFFWYFAEFCFVAFRV